jgi:hypothetical protein
MLVFCWRLGGAVPGRRSANHTRGSAAQRTSRRCIRHWRVFSCCRDRGIKADRETGRDTQREERCQLRADGAQVSDRLHRTSHIIIIAHRYYMQCVLESPGASDESARAPPA